MSTANGNHHFNRRSSIVLYAPIPVLEWGRLPKDTQSITSFVEAGANGLVLDCLRVCKDVRRFNDEWHTLQDNPTISATLHQFVHAVDFYVYGIYLRALRSPSHARRRNIEQQRIDEVEQQLRTILSHIAELGEEDSAQGIAVSVAAGLGSSCAEKWPSMVPTASPYQLRLQFSSMMPWIRPLIVAELRKDRPFDKPVPALSQNQALRIGRPTMHYIALDLRHGPIPGLVIGASPVNWRLENKAPQNLLPGGQKSNYSKGNMQEFHRLTKHLRDVRLAGIVDEARSSLLSLRRYEADEGMQFERAPDMNPNAEELREPELRLRWACREAAIQKMGHKIRGGLWKEAGDAGVPFLTPSFAVVKLCYWCIGTLGRMPGARIEAEEEVLRRHVAKNGWKNKGSYGHSCAEVEVVHVLRDYQGAGNFD